MKTSSLKKCFLFAALAGTMSVCADSTVSDVTLVQEQSTRTVTITYKLTGDDAIVTVDLLRDGQSIGDEHLTTLSGNVNRLIAADESAVRTVVWHPDIDWPGQRKQPLVAKVTAWSPSAPPNYMVVDLTDKSREYYTSEKALPLGGISNDVYRVQKVVFRKIPAKGVTWRMGSPEGETGRGADETPHLVTLTHDYWMGVFELTQGQYEFAQGSSKNNDSFFTNRTCYLTRPLDSVGGRMIWNTGATSLAGSRDLPCGKESILYIMRQASGLEVSLPTEAEWEYACRAGTGTALSSGKNLTAESSCQNVAELGRYNGNSGGVDDSKATSPSRELDDTVGTSRVGIYKPNSWGLYDMHGNVAEFCYDEYGAYDGSMEAALANPDGPKTGTGTGSQVVRGGSWGWFSKAATLCRSATRKSAAWSYNKTDPNRNFGVRLRLLIP